MASEATQPTQAVKTAQQEHIMMPLQTNNARHVGRGGGCLGRGGETIEREKEGGGEERGGGGFKIMLGLYFRHLHKQGTLDVHVFKVAFKVVILDYWIYRRGIEMFGSGGINKHFSYIFPKSCSS